MRNYYFLASERIDSLYNQLVARTPDDTLNGADRSKHDTVLTETRVQAS